jgi:hypothetical protein
LRRGSAYRPRTFRPPRFCKRGSLILPRIFVNRAPLFEDPRLFDWRRKRVETLDAPASWPGRRPGGNT